MIWQVAKRTWLNLGKLSIKVIQGEDPSSLFPPNLMLLARRDKAGSWV